MEDGPTVIDACLFFLIPGFRSLIDDHRMQPLPQAGLDSVELKRHQLFRVAIGRERYHGAAFIAVTFAPHGPYGDVSSVGRRLYLTV